MAVDAGELVISPFKEVVERGKDAVAAAAAAETTGQCEPGLSNRMAIAGRAVVREGQRALQRVQPIWDARVEKHGDIFKDAFMKQGNHRHRFSS